MPMAIRWVYTLEEADGGYNLTIHGEPWSAVPADDKPYVRLIVARILADTLMRLELRYPVLDHDRTTEFRDMRGMLRSETASAVSDRPANRG